MRAVLRQLWAEPRAPDPPPVGRRDLALLVVVLAIATVEVILRPDLEPTSPSVIVAFVVLPSLLGRRAQPLLMVASSFGVLTLVGLTGAPGVRTPAPDTTAFVLMLPYALLRWGSGREVLLGVLVLVGVIGVDQWWTGAPPGELLGGLAVVSASTAFGASARFRERARRQELAHVRVGERERLARDLHDTVAHHVSAIAIQAQAGLAGAPHRPAAATEALAVIAAEASRTLAELRAMVHVLREEEAGESPPLVPTAGVADLQGLARAEGPGPTIDVELRGDLDALLPAVSSALFRVGQESITNARRHARRATRVSLRVEATASAVTLVTEDDGEPAERRPPGLGLRGMQERAALLGGRCLAGPGPERGWRVELTLPRGDPRP